MAILNDKFKLEINFDRNQSCPLCHSINNKKKVSSYKNVYSELISKYLNFDEEFLIKFASFHECSNCSLYYWANTISRQLRAVLYKELLPIHPKGTDATEIYFSKKGLKNKIHGLKNSSSKRVRIINGYYSSFKFENDFEKEICKNALGDLNNKSNLDILDMFFKRGPKSLSRHAGFKKTLLNKFIIENFKKSDADNFKYIEYGCPLWGPLQIFVESKFKCLSIIPKNYVFWSNYLFEYDHQSNLEIINENEFDSNSYNLNGATLGLILILDHLENPLFFLKRFFEMGIKAVTIIVEKIQTKKGLPIQHLTGWNKESLTYLSNSLNLKIKFIDDTDDTYIFAVLEN